MTVNLRHFNTRPRGFTLMELLIALALVSLMLVLLFGGLRLGARSWDAVEMHTERSGSERLIWSFLQRTLTEMLAVSLPGETKPHIAFSGNRDAVEFVGLLPDRVGPGGAYVLRIEAPRADNGRNLVMRRWLYHPEVLEGLEGVPPWKPLYERVGEPKPRSADAPANSPLYGEHLLVAAIEKLEFRYYGKTKGSGGPSWHDEWKENRVMPELVELRLSTAQGEWPPLRAAVPAMPSEARGTVAQPVRGRRR